MITVTGIPTFQQYLAASRYGMLHTTFRRKLYFIARVYALPILGLVGLPVMAWIHIEAWPDAWQYTFDVPTELFLFCLFLLISPLFYRRAMRRRYTQQDVDKPVTVEFSEQGAHVIIPLKVDMRMEWAAFTAFAEIPHFFLLFTKPNQIPIMVPTDGVPPDQQAELRTLLAAHLKPKR
jgi:hypothetical protein